MTTNLHHHDHREGQHESAKATQLSLAHNGTLHCLLGCGIGAGSGLHAWCNERRSE